MKALAIGTRQASEDFWSMSGVLGDHSKAHVHSPFLVYVELPANKALLQETSYLEFCIKHTEDWDNDETRQNNAPYPDFITRLDQDVAKLPEQRQKLEALREKAKDNRYVPTVVVHTKMHELLEQHYPDDTLIVKAWPGQWRTDYFSFTLKELKERYEHSKR